MDIMQSGYYCQEMLSGWTSDMDFIDVEMMEQPKEFFRFRNKNERGKPERIQGENSSDECKSYPTIKVSGYDGKVYVSVSLLTRDYEKHTCYLGNRTNPSIKKYTVRKEGTLITFKDLCIFLISDQEACAVFKGEWMRQKGVHDPAMLTPEQEHELSSEIRAMKSKLKEVILCFEVIPVGTRVKAATCYSTPVKHSIN